MANLLTRAASWLAAKMTAKVATTVTYTQDGTEYEVPALLGKYLFALASDYDGARIEWSDKDFLISPDDLTVEPAQGDTIVYDGDTYIVNAPGDEPVWRWCDGHEKLMRIHAKKVEDA